MRTNTFGAISNESKIFLSCHYDNSNHLDSFQFASGSSERQPPTIKKEAETISGRQTKGS